MKHLNLKTICLLTSTLTTVGYANPNTLSPPLETSTYKEKVLYSKVVQLPVDISSAKLKLSAADYASPVVKVLVPELAAVTFLNHRNTGEGAPCMATYEAFTPEEVIQNYPAIENYDFSIKLTKIVELAPPSTDLVADQMCNVTLLEEIKANIRGFEFSHVRSQNLGNRHVDDCK